MPRDSRAVYGRIAEELAADKYRLKREGEHSAFRDAVDRQGRPVEIKSSAYRRAAKTGEHREGRRYPGYFELQAPSHAKLLALDQGSYVFVVLDIDKESLASIEDPIRRVAVSRVHRALERQGAVRDAGTINIRWDTLFELVGSGYI